jgi:hypothetical protein
MELLERGLVVATSQVAAIDLQTRAECLGPVIRRIASFCPARALGAVAAVLLAFQAFSSDASAAPKSPLRAAAAHTSAR